MACHDLMNKSAPPPTFHSLLCLSLNFCVIPETTTSRIAESLEHFCQYLYLRVFFAGNDLPVNKLFVQSEWEPPLEAIPAKLCIQKQSSKRPSQGSFGSNAPLPT
jgi:hypothetical protein